MNKRFKQLIIEAYKMSKKSKNLVGLVYGAIFSYGFSDITDIEGFVNSSPVDMLYLKSLFSGVELDIYEYDLVDFKTAGKNGIYIKLKNKELLLVV